MKLISNIICSENNEPSGPQTISELTGICRIAGPGGISEKVSYAKHCDYLYAQQENVVKCFYLLE